jgi:hypothetical protein
VGIKHFHFKTAPLLQKRRTFMREVTANTIGKKLDTNPSDQKLLEKKQRDLLRRERIRKFGEQLGFFEHDDSLTSSYSE